MNPEIEIVQRGFYVPGTDNPPVLFQGEQLPDEAKRLLSEHDLLQAVMHVEVSPEFWEEELRRMNPWCDFNPPFILLDTYLKNWVEKCGWFCLVFPGFVQSHRPTASGKILVYVAGRMVSPRKKADMANSGE